MNINNLETLLACPRCKKKVKPTYSRGKCSTCGFSFKKVDDIWHFLYMPNSHSKTSMNAYEAMHQEECGGPTDGSYEILARIARGNRTVDIACGEGLIERLAPEAVGVEFSLSALKKAKANGAKYLVLADAHALPFQNDSFDIAICAGSIEHFDNPQKAITEMARISKIQVLTVHRYIPVPFAPLAYSLLTKILRITHQPIEVPLPQDVLYHMLEKAGLSVVFKGVWTLPVNYGRPIKLLPELKHIPSCSFVISVKR